MVKPAENSTEASVPENVVSSALLRFLVSRTGCKTQDPGLAVLLRLQCTSLVNSLARFYFCRIN